MGSDQDWPDMAAELRRALADGLDVRGTIDESEVSTNLGSSSLEVVLEVSDLEDADQASAYTELCDLLATRLRQGWAQVAGCLVFAGEPDAASLVTGLTGMQRDSGVFTPVIPLSRTQAEALAATTDPLVDLFDAATSLIAIAADRHPVTDETAETLLDELDELIDRRA